MKLLSRWLSSGRLVVLLAILDAASLFCAQAQTPSPGGDRPWAATSQTSGSGAPSRIRESHTRSGNRTVDKQTVEVLGPDGQYRPYLDTETETVQVDGSTTRTIVRTYGRNSSGDRNLTQVREEEARSSANGEGKLVRTTSNPDLNGNLQVVQREVSQTRKTSPEAQETKTTVYMPQGGSMVPVQQTEESQRRGGGGNIDVKQTTLLPDGNGNWQVGEIKQSTIREEGKNLTTEERVSRPGSDGKLAEISRTVGRETEGANQQKTATFETYTLDSPGYSGDGKLHLNQRITTIQKREANGATTERLVEQPNPGAPDANLRLTTRAIDIVRGGASGTLSTGTIELRDASGSFRVVSVDTRNSDQIPPPPVEIAPAPETTLRKAK
jgi:hypothetical protein